MMDRFPVGPRFLALILMVLGAASFVAARLMFGDQVLCLLGSTLVTFGGLALIVAARRYGWEQSWKDARQVETRRPERPHRTAQPRSTRPEGGSTVAYEPRAQPEAQENRPAARPLPRPAPSIQAMQQEPYQPMPALSLRVMKILRQQGARVTVETRREDRSILKIETGQGEVFQAMVLEDAVEVDVAELRALLALVTSSISSGGYLITGGAFTQRALDWAAGKPLRLLTQDELGQLTV